jgi:pyrroline-5-carboxylate reductase
MQKKTKRPAEKRRAVRPKKAPSFAIGFIGAGNMATALVKGLVAAGLYEKSQICASDVDSGRRSIAERKLGITVAADNAFVAQRSRTIVLAVKPQIINDIMAELSRVASPRHLFVSILAGVPTARIEAGLGGSARVVRVMPNTPALLGKGMAVVVRGRHATAADEKLALRLLRSVGEARAVADEALLDPVTGLSGSGPAYVYLFAEALIAGGKAAGLPEELSRDLALQTITGAAAMLQQSGETPQRLREMVTSPGGTTLAGLTELGRRGFVDGVAAAIVEATRRSVELGRG